MQFPKTITLKRYHIIWYLDSVETTNKHVIYAAFTEDGDYLPDFSKWDNQQREDCLNFLKSFFSRELKSDILLQFDDILLPSNKTFVK